MEKTMIEGFKTMFLEIQQKILANTDHEELADVAKGDEVDLTLNDQNNQLRWKLKGREAFYLRKVYEALDRIEDGTFGQCDECGCEIGISRLKARPTATMCINCKEEQEKEEGQVLYHKRSHTHGKTFLSEGQAI